MAKREKIKKEKEQNQEDLDIKKSDKETRKKQNKQVMIALFMMISMILIVIVVPIVIKNYTTNFQHLGLDFEKTKMGSITLYAINIPITDKKYNKIGDYQYNFREDPRELDYIKIDVPDEEIIFERDGPTYITMESDLPVCEDNLIAVADLTEFLKGFGGLTVRGALSNITYANESKILYVSCESHPNNTVIMINHANETIIRRSGKNCYEINYKDCEINKATEKFELIIVDKYMSILE